MKVQLSPVENRDCNSREGCQFDGLPLEKDHFLARGNKELAWKKYCGFMEFSVVEFNAIQKLLLKEQIEISARSPLGMEFFGDRVPESLDEFRRFTPLTTCSDYSNCWASKTTLELSENSSFDQAAPEAALDERKVPLNHSSARALVDDAITALILSSATFKGDVRLEPLDRMLISLKARSISEAVNKGISQRLECDNLILDGDGQTTESGFALASGIEKGLKNGVDFIISTAESIARLGEYMDVAAIRSHSSGFTFPVSYRLLRAWLMARFSGRPCLAKDIWQVKGLVCCDGGNGDYGKQIERAWGVRPLNVYYTPEGGFMALQSWNKKDLTFIPYRNLYEFIPMPELEKEATDGNYVPATVLMHEVKPGDFYELIVTNFRGGPFLRYRTGDFLQATALKDEETGVNLPQFKLCPRSNQGGSLNH